MRKISKKLITKSNCEGYISAIDGKIYISKDMVLTPGAKDVMRNKGIVICYGEARKEKIKCDDIKSVQLENKKVDDEKKITEDIVRLLRFEYKITDVNVIQKVVQKVFDSL